MTNSFENKKKMKSFQKGVSAFLAAGMLITCIFLIYFHYDTLNFQLEYAQLCNDNNLNNIEQLHNDIPILLSQISSNKDLISYSLGKEPITSSTKKNITDALSIFCFEKEISNMLIINPHRNEIYLYSGANFAINSLEEFLTNNPQFTAAKQKNKEIGTFCMPVSYLFPDQELPCEYISFFYNDYRGLTFVINVTPSYFENYLSNQYLEYPIPYTLILQNEEGDILFSGGDCVAENDFQEISEHITADDVTLSFPYYISSTGSKNYIITSVVSVTDILSYTLKTSTFILIILALLATTFVLIFFLFEYKKKVIELKHLSSIRSLENDKKSLSLGLAINKLLNNELLALREKDLINHLLLTNDDVSFRAMLVTLDHYRNDSSYNTSSLFDAIQNIIHEIFADNQISSYFASINNSMFGILLHGSDSDLSKEKIRFCIDQYTDMIHKYHQISMSTIISTPYKSNPELNIMSLYDALNYRFMCKRGCILFTDDLTPSRKDLEIPKELHDKILSSILSNDEKMYNQYLDEFFSILKEGDYVTAKNLCIQLLLNMDESLMGAINNLPSYNIMTELINAVYLEDMIRIFKEAFSFSTDKFSQEDYYRKVINEVIESEYANPQFSSSQIADTFGITTAYFGQKFKQIYQTNFSNFLMEYRLEHARHLLLNSNNTNAQLAEECGFNSETYFISSFKKHYGKTPKNYKAAHQRNILGSENES